MPEEEGHLKEPKSEKSFLAAAFLCFFLGIFGAHRFYVGRVGSGILMLITFGGLGIWMLIDFILILSGRFRDDYGFLISNSR